MAGRPRPLSKAAAEPAKGKAGANAVDTPTSKPYLSIAELAQLTPWTDQAIRTMISRGIFREGVHYFYVGRRPVFKWTAIVGFIERGKQPEAETERVPHYRDQVGLWDENVEPATKPVRSK